MFYYPGSYSEQEKQIQESQAAGHDLVISIHLTLDYNQDTCVALLSLFDLAVSLGRVESLICQPATMIHESFDEKFQEKRSVSPKTCNA